VIDFQMPEMNGLDAARYIVELSPKTPILMVTIHLSKQCIMKECPAKRRRAPPPLRYAVQGFAPLRRRLGVTAMVNRVGEDYRRT
jgi:CheY-like chemotaxis protein